MVDADKQRPQPVRRTSNTSNTSTAASRAAKRRVELDGSSSPKKPAARPPSPPRPWWRRGGFWFLVIVLEVVVALIISYNAPSALEDVDLEGGDLAQFCGQVTQSMQASAPGASLDIGQLADEFQREADVFRRLSAVAPTALVGDLVKLADQRAELAQTTRDIHARQVADPRNFQTALPDAAKAQGDTEARGFDSITKMNRYVLHACNIDLSVPATVPGTTPATTPGTTAPASETSSTVASPGSSPPATTS